LPLSGRYIIIVSYICIVMFYLVTPSAPCSPQSMLTLKMFVSKHGVLLLFLSLAQIFFLSLGWAVLYLVYIAFFDYVFLLSHTRVSTGVLRMCVRERSHTRKGSLIPLDFLLLQGFYIFIQSLLMAHWAEAYSLVKNIRHFPVNCHSC
jgi:hypothetical protein